ESKRHDLAKWISTVDFADQQFKSLQRSAEGTGQWFLDSPEYLEWEHGETKELWCPGSAGVGKTILMSIVIEHLRKQFNLANNCAVIHIYFRHQTKYTVHELICSLLAQLCHSRLMQSSDVDTLQRAHSALLQVLQVLHAEIDSYERMFIIVDALDECPDSSRNSFMEIVRGFPNVVSLLVTSRDIPSIQEHFSTTPRLEIFSKDSDLRTSIARRIKDDRLESMLSKCGYSVSDVQNRVVAKAGGMFLLAALHMDSLLHHANPRSFKRALGNLPNTLNGTYDEALDRIKAQSEVSRNLALQIISWITMSFRPLSLVELQHALAIPEAVEEGMQDLDDNSDLLSDPNVMLSSCAGLVTIIEEPAELPWDLPFQYVHFIREFYSD
ncbi:hypothetical protein C8J56DRAFT_775590, partial [Mycena floridula]